MNKLRILLRAQLLGAFGVNKALHSGDPRQKRRLALFGVLAVFVAASLLFSIVMYDVLYMQAFMQAGQPELLPALMMAAASLVTLFTTVYKTRGLLFSFRDYDLTMALPVKTPVVAASRLILLYAMNAGACLLITIPAGFVYAFFTAPPWWYYPIMLILPLFVPLIPMLAGTAGGVLTAAISSRFRHAGAVNILLSLLLVLALMALSFSTPAVFTEPEAVSRTISSAVYGAYPLTRLYTRAVCGGDGISLLLFALASAALFLVFALALGRFYKRLNTALSSSSARANYRVGALHSASPLSALYRRELRRYLSSSLYVMNTGIGMILALLGCGALLFAEPSQLETALEIPGFARLAGSLAPLMLCIPVSMSCTACCSVSLEGQTLWIVKSLPVRSAVIFAAKLLVNLTVTVPLSAVCAVLLTVSLPVNPAQAVFLFLTPAVFAVLTAETGLLVNLMIPRFDWTNEVTVIKQSMPVIICILGGMTVTIVCVILLGALPAGWHMPALAGITLTAAGLDALFWRLLQTKGARLFHALG